MSSRTRQRVQTGKTAGSQGGRARAPPSSHLDNRRAKSAAKSILRNNTSVSSGSVSRNARRAAVKKPTGAMPEIDMSDLVNEFSLPSNQTEPYMGKSANNKNAPARSLAELNMKRKASRMPYLHEAVDIDGDGIIDEVEIQLSKILCQLEGEDLDGDGTITEEETKMTRVMKGKEILAKQFVALNSHIRDFWEDYKGMDDASIVKAIVNNVDYRMHMSNLTNKAMQHELLYDSSRVADSIKIIATDRDRRWQRKKAQMVQNRKKLFDAKYQATLNSQYQSKINEQKAEQIHRERQRRTFTPMLKTNFVEAAAEITTQNIFKSKK